MDPARTPPRDDVARAPDAPAILGGDVGRWIREADDRLASLDAPARGVPRADDFGHVTRVAPPRPATPAPTASATPPAPPVVPSPARARGTSSAGGIVVASGWGGRSRT